MKKIILIMAFMLLLLSFGCSNNNILKTCNENCINNGYESGECEWTGSKVPQTPICEGKKLFENKVSDCKNQGNIGSSQVCCCLD